MEQCSYRLYVMGVLKTTRCEGWTTKERTAESAEIIYSRRIIGGLRAGLLYAYTGIASERHCVRVTEAVKICPRKNNRI